MKRVGTVLATIFLAVAMLLTGNPGITHAVEGTTKGLTYVADVQVFQGPSMEACVKLCEEMGYTPTHKNLNEGSVEKVSFGFDKDSPCVMLGYVATTNRSLAITDISLLHMGEGYEIRDFRSIAAALLAKNQSYAEGLAAAASDFARNYENGAPAAVQAYKALDLMYVDDLDKHTFEGYLDNLYGPKTDLGLPLRDVHTIVYDIQNFGLNTIYREYDWSDHEPLSQFVCDGKADAEFFNKLLAFGTPSIVNAINMALCSGSAEYQNYYNLETQSYETQVWAERISTDDAKVIIEEGITDDEWRKFDSAYMDSARDLSKCVQDFTTQYLNAKASGANVADAFSSEEGSGGLESVASGVKDKKEEDIYWLYVAAFDTLNQYRYSDDKLLGDWIVEMGQRTYASEEDYRALYPLADAISPSQLIMAKYCGFVTLVNKMRQPTVQDAEADAAFSQVIEGLRKTSKEGTEYRVSVWTGVDPSVYYGKIAMTSDAIRKAGASAVLQLTEAERAAENAYVRGLYITIGTGLLDAFAIVTNMIVTYKASALLAVGAEAGVASLGGMWGFLATASAILGWVGFAITALGIVAAIVTAIYKLVRDELYQPPSEYIEIPTLVYETKKTASSANERIVKYTAIWEPQAARVGDTNAYTGYKWNCLYISHDEDAGSPLAVREGLDPFQLTTDVTTPAGYEPVSLFGQLSAADLNDGAYEVRDGRHNYLYFTTEKSLAALDAANDQKEQGKETQPKETGKEGLYISDIVVFTADTEERARAKVADKKGTYYLLDRNLGNTKTPIYLGYALTNDENAAVKDVRVVAKEAEQQIMYGSASYAYSGSLLNGDGLYISTDSSVGTPILSELSIVTKKEDIPEGWEPVVYASGAPVYMFDEGEDQCAIYFEPKVKYTSGETYIGGMAFLTSNQPSYGYDKMEHAPDNWLDALDVQEKRDAVDSMLELASWQEGGIAVRTDDYYGTYPQEVGSAPRVRSHDVAAIDNVINMSSGMSYVDSFAPDDWYTREISTYLMYSFTHNPYRAIRDVCLYSSTTKNDFKLPSSISKGILLNQNGVEKMATGSYVACEEVLSETSRLIDSSNGSTRGTHAYLNTGIRRGVEDFYVEPYDDGSQCAWSRSKLVMRGLYVLGPVDDMEPLKSSDVVISDEPYDSRYDDGNIGTKLPAQSYTLDGNNAEGEDFRSVQDIKYPYNLPAQNLSYPEFFDESGDSLKYSYSNKRDIESAGLSDPLYLYLRGNVHRPKYISSVTVGTYESNAFREENPKMDKDSLKIMDKTAEDTAWRAALASSNAELIGINFAVKAKEAWNNKSESDRGEVASTEYAPTASYVAVSRTDDVNKAIRGLVLLKDSAAREGTAPLAEVEIKGRTKYTLPSGSGMIPMETDNYYLYQSYNSATVPGQPITELLVDDFAFHDGMATVLCSSNKGADASPSGNPDLTNFLHCDYLRKEGASYINALYVGTGPTLGEALRDAMSQGATECIMADINQENVSGNKDEGILLKSGQSMVLGYRMVTATDEQLAQHKRFVGTNKDPLRDAIRDVVLTVGQPLKDTLIHNGVLYKPSSRTNLNEKTDAPEMYLYECMDYYTLAYNNDSANANKLVVPSLRAALASPLVGIGMAAGDRVPYNTALEGTAEDGSDKLLRWENVLSTKGSKTDLNYGLIHGNVVHGELSMICTGALDNRRYLFVRRADNSVKPGAEITGGFIDGAESVGELWGKDE